MKYDLIMCIVNQGFAYAVMDAARVCGVSGGTVINGIGTAKRDAEKMFNISIQPEKEIVFTLVPSSIRDDVLHAVYQNAGMNTSAQGIAFSVPVDGVVGLRGGNGKEEYVEVDEPKTENN